jgi:hypothetical protein
MHWVDLLTKETRKQRFFFFFFFFFGIAGYWLRSLMVLVLMGEAKVVLYRWMSCCVGWIIMDRRLPWKAADSCALIPI